MDFRQVIGKYPLVGLLKHCLKRFSFTFLFGLGFRKILFHFPIIWLRRFERKGVGRLSTNP